MKIETVSIIGLGYIGLPTAAVMASRGVKVIGVDVNQKAVETINQGRIHIVEPELDILVHGAINAGTLRATTIPEKAQAFLIAVPTPFKGDHEPDMSYIEAAAKSLAPVLEKGNLVVLESTSPVGATEQLSQWLADARPDLTFPHQVGEEADINMAYCPERVLPGHVVKELVENDRVVGGMTRKCAERAVKVYKTFVQGECVVTDARTAEMSKLTENSFRDVNIAFANELSMICEKLGINVWELIALANRHPRVKILQPGPGVGGHCIAVDPWFIVSAAPEESKLIRSAREVNNAKPHFVLNKVREAAQKFAEPKIACFGLSFKANIDDLRESPSVEITREIVLEKLGEILVVEPFIEALPGELSNLPGVRLVDAETALQQANIVIGLVDHDQFREISKEVLAGKSVIDTRGMWK